MPHNDASLKETQYLGHITQYTINSGIDTLSICKLKGYYNISKISLFLF